ncbi:MAG: ADYC domain-containing protein [Nannocystaceae bacterium]
MTSHARIILLLLPALGLLSACDDPTAAEFAADGSIEVRDGPGNGGPVFNTNILEGTDVPAIDTTGVPLGGVTLVDVKYLRLGVLTSIPVSTLWVDHGTLRTHLLQKFAPVGADFIGSRWTFDVGGGHHVVATLVNVETSDDAGLYKPGLVDELLKLDPERDVYTFVYDDIPNSPIHTCAEDSSGGARMVLYGDIIVDESTGVVSSRPDTLYFGCISGAVGKAALWGYAPDSPSLPSISMEGFTTAIRAVRADYCADGVSHTLAGHLLTVRDQWAINNPPSMGYFTEAIWEEGTGAICVNRVRRTEEILTAPFECPGGATIPLCPTAASIEADWSGGYGDIWTKIP